MKGRVNVKVLRSCGLVLVLTLLVVGAAQGAGVNPYWQRMAEGFQNRVVVHEYVYVHESPDLEVSVRIPQLVGTFDPEWEQGFNQNLRDRLAAYVTELKEIAAEAWDLEGEYRPFPYQGIVDFEVKLNRGGLLSIAIVNYVFTGGAHGTTAHEYINLDLTTGQSISFHALFNTDAELERAAEKIDAKIGEEPDWFFIDKFTPELFAADQGFFLQDHHAVICFAHYELAPYAAGVQEFAVPAP